MPELQRDKMIPWVHDSANISTIQTFNGQNDASDAPSSQEYPRDGKLTEVATASSYPSSLYS